MAFYTFLPSGQDVWGWAKKLVQDLNKRDAQILQLITNISNPATGIVRFYGSVGYRPAAGEELFDLEMNGDEVFPAGLAFNSGSFDAAPANDIALPIYVNDVIVGSMNGTVGSKDATWTMAAEYRATRGDRLRFNSCTPQDPTMSGPRYTWIGTRTA